ncbi:uncharacterized protein [Physcomitrium patens]|uniref:uncharacterized protein n=1 Tax=Physcomitrium patens TaxID=3218 RepID=UPI00024AF860
MSRSTSYRGGLTPLVRVSGNRRYTEHGDFTALFVRAKDSRCSSLSVHVLHAVCAYISRLERSGMLSPSLDTSHFTGDSSRVGLMQIKMSWLARLGGDHPRVDLSSTHIRFGSHGILSLFKRN